MGHARISFAVLAVLLAAPLAAQDTIDAREIARIGSIGGPDWITRPGAMRIDADGSLLVLFPSESVVRRLSPSGEFLEVYGGHGDGPGELRSPWGLELVEDELWVFGQYRVTKFDLSSGEVQAVNTAEWFSGNSSPGERDVVGVIPTGDLIIGQSRASARSGGVPLVLATLEGDVGATVATVHVEDVVVFKNPNPGGFGELQTSPPYPMSDLWAIHRALPGILIADVRSRRESGEVVLRTVLLDGTEYDSAVVQLAHRVEVPAQERRQIESTMTGVLLRSRGVDIESERVAGRMIREQFGDLRYRHAARRTFVASDGTVWLEAPRPIMREAPEPAIWTVLSPQLEVLKRVSLRPGLTLLDAKGDRAWATEQDDLGVPYLVELDVGPSR